MTSAARWIAHISAALLLLHTTTSCADAKNTTNEGTMVERIEYWTNAPDDAYPTRLILARDGRAELEVTSNDDDPARPDIGRYEMQADAATFEQLAKLVSDNTFAQHPNPGPVEPGDVIRRFTVYMAGAKIVQRHVAGVAAADAGFARAEQAALNLVTQVRTHPRHALAIGMNMAPAGGAGRMRFDVTLTNIGKELVALPAVGQWDGLGIALNVTARRNDVPLAQMSNDHQVFVELGASTLVSKPASLPAIAPGAKQQFVFETTLAPPPGKYDVWGALTVQLLDEKGRALLQGELVSQRIPLAR